MGAFSAAPTNLFPIDTLMTVQARKVLFADFNGDGRNDMFISSQGWDVAPSPGEQNRLYLSLPDGGRRDATAPATAQQFLSRADRGRIDSGRGLIVSSSATRRPRGRQDPPLHAAGPGAGGGAR